MPSEQYIPEHGALSHHTLAEVEIADVCCGSSFEGSLYGPWLRLSIILRWLRNGFIAQKNHVISLDAQMGEWDE